MTYSPYIEFLASSFLNGSLASPDGLKDRAFLGWKNEIDTLGLNFQWSEIVYQLLASSYNLRDATLVATCTCPETGTSSLGNRTFVFPAIYGDTLMKMHGVYGDTNIENAAKWYRPL